MDRPVILQQNHIGNADIFIFPYGNPTISTKLWAGG